MTWIAFYLGCLAVGLLLCAVTAMTGGHGAGHGAAHPHLGSHGIHRGHGMSALNGFTITAFLCWFGGVGYLLQTQAHVFTGVVLAVAVAAGMVGASILQRFLTRVLLPRERELTADDTPIAGVVGRVSGPLTHDRVGEVLYTQLGARRSVPARSADGRSIDRDAEVVVLRYEQGIAYVQPWHELESERH